MRPDVVLGNLLSVESTVGDGVVNSFSIIRAPVKDPPMATRAPPRGDVASDPRLRAKPAAYSGRFPPMALFAWTHGHQPFLRAGKNVGAKNLSFFPRG